MLNRKSLARLLLWPALTLAALAATPASAQFWQASADFSTLQGYHQWRYMSFRPSDSTYSPMLYGTNFFGGESWYGLDELGNVDSTIIVGDTMHPSHRGNEAARVWESPIAGTVRVTGRVAEDNPNPRNGDPVDGVHVSIWKNGELLFSADIADSDFTGYSYDLSVHVMPGDWLIFRVAPHSNFDYDSTYFDPTIAVQSLDQESGSPWIADVLTDEATYVAGLDTSMFVGATDNTRIAHRLSISHELKVAANHMTAGETNAAMEALLNVIVRINYDPNPPDWMVDGPEKTALFQDMLVLLDLLRSP